LIFKMECEGYLNIKSTGAVRYTKKKVGLEWNEVAVRVEISIPDQLFKRPLISAKIKVSEDVVPKPQPTEIILNTKELIEESTGAKIEFSVKPYEDENE